jgi:hypothetical protein
MTVIMSAGSVEIELTKDSVVMIGPVEICYVGHLPVVD